MRPPSFKSKVLQKDQIDHWKLLKGDEVYVNMGKDKGKTGTILKVFRKHNKMLVKGVNKAKKAIKSTESFKGGIFQKEMPIHYSNLQLMDPETRKPIRVHLRKIDGKRVRVSARTGQVIPRPETKYLQLMKTRDIKDGPKDTPPEIAQKQTWSPSLNDLD